MMLGAPRKSRRSVRMVLWCDKVYAPGDFVYLRAAEPKPYVGQIAEVFLDSADGRNAPHMLCRWFYRADEVNRSRGELQELFLAHEIDCEPNSFATLDTEKRPTILLPAEFNRHVADEDVYFVICVRLRNKKIKEHTAEEMTKLLDIQKDSKHSYAGWKLQAALIETLLPHLKQFDEIDFGQLRTILARAATLVDRELRSVDSLTPEAITKALDDVFAKAADGLPSDAEIEAG